MRDFAASAAAFEHTPQPEDGTHAWVQKAVPVIGVGIFSLVALRRRNGFLYGLPGWAREPGRQWLRGAEQLAATRKESLARESEYWRAMAVVRDAEGSKSPAEEAYLKAMQLSKRDPPPGCIILSGSPPGRPQGRVGSQIRKAHSVKFPSSTACSDVILAPTCWLHRPAECIIIQLTE
jgi:hypothetical protein